MSVSTFVGFEFPSFESAHPEMLGRWGRVERWDRVLQVLPPFGMFFRKRVSENKVH